MDGAALRRDMERLRRELRTEIAGVRRELRKDIRGRATEGSVVLRIADAEVSHLRWLAGMAVVLFVAFFGGGAIVILLSEVFAGRGS